VKFVPETLIELIVTGALPVEVSVSDCADFVFTFTLPKLRLDALAPSVAVVPVSCREKVSVTPPALAVSNTVVAVLTAVAVAVKLPVDVPAATFTVAGRVTVLLLLARFTVNPPLPAATFNVTEQLSVPAPATELLMQARPVNAGTPAPLRLIDVELPVEELLVSVSEPVVAPATAGSNCTVRVAD
jgi:hypothetical protein